MNVEVAVDILRQTITMSLVIVSPVLVTAIVVGVTVSLLQSVTSIQEQTLTFVPKLVAVAGVMVVTAHWMIRSLMEFTIGTLEHLPDFIR